MSDLLLEEHAAPVLGSRTKEEREPLLQRITRMKPDPR